MQEAVSVKMDMRPLEDLQRALARYQVATKSSGAAVARRAFMGFVYGNNAKGGGVNKGISYSGMIDQLRTFEAKGSAITAVEMMLKSGQHGIHSRDQARDWAEAQMGGAKTVIAKVTRNTSGGVKVQVIKRMFKGAKVSKKGQSVARRLNVSALAAARELSLRHAARKSMVAALLFKKAASIATKRKIVQLNLAQSIRGYGECELAANGAQLVVGAIAGGFDKPRARQAVATVARGMVRDIDAYLAGREKRRLEAALKKQSLSDSAE